MKYKKLTQSAKGKECNLRIYPYCCGDTETTVFCHAPSVDKGIGLKSPDWWGAFGCRVCHDIVDGRIQTELSKSEVTECFMRGIYLTLREFIEEGLIKL